MKPTHWIIIGLVVAVAALDVTFALVDGMPTISEAVWGWTASHPIVPFGAGVICGHLFWQR